MPHIHHEAICHAPLQLVWDYSADYRNIPKYLFGITECRPVGDLDHGLGAVFEATFHVAPVTLKSTIEVTEYDAPHRFGTASRSGFSNQSVSTYTELGPAETKIVVDFDYQLPGGLAGKALGQALVPVFAISVKMSDANFRRQVEELHREGPAR